MAQDQFTQNTDSPSFSNNNPSVLPEHSRIPSTTSSSGFSSATWWDELNSDFEQDLHHGVNNNNNNNNCMDFMNNITWEDYDEGVADFGGLPNINASDFHLQDQEDTYFFQNIDLENNINLSDCRNDAASSDQPVQQKDKQIIVITDDDPHQQQQEQSAAKIKRKGSKDLAAVFLAWLKANKGLISAEDLRRVKLKRSTIESSIERFGGGEQGMKRLLKLILKWVQKHHMPHEENIKRAKSVGEPSSSHTRPNPGLSPNFAAQNGTNDPDGTGFIVRSSSLTLQRPPHVVLPYAGVSTTMAYDGTAGFSSLVGSTNNPVIDFSNPYQPNPGLLSPNFSAQNDTNDPNGTGFIVRSSRLTLQRPPRIVLPYADYPWSSPSQFAIPSPSKEARRSRMAKQKRVLPNHDEHNQIEHYHQAATSSRSTSPREEGYISTTSPAATSREEGDDIPASVSQVYNYWS